MDPDEWLAEPCGFACLTGASGAIEGIFEQPRPASLATTTRMGCALDQEVGYIESGTDRGNRLGIDTTLLKVSDQMVTAFRAGIIAVEHHHYLV